MTAETAPPRINRGLSLISMAIVLGIVLVAAPIGLERYSNYMEEQTWHLTATHLSTVSQGARRYIKDNYNDLLTQAKTGTVTVTGQALRDTGYLPPGFSLTNNNGQNYVVAIALNPTPPDKLVAFVLTSGGQQITFKGQRYIAQNIAGLGGYIYPENIANGAGGGWEVNLTHFGLSGQNGHLAAYLSSDVLGTDAEESDRLYRFEVNGRPDLNKMHTAIDMGSNDINNTRNLNAETGQFSGDLTARNGNFSESVTASQGMTANNDIRSNDGWIVTRNNKGWLNETHQGGFYMSDDDWVRSVNNKGIYTGGQVRGGTIRADDTLTAGGTLQLEKISTVGTSCPQIGRQSRDGTGAPLYCIDWVWKKSGGGIDFANAVHQYVGDGGKCPANHVVIGVGGFYATYTAGYLWCAPQQ